MAHRRHREAARDGLQAAEDDIDPRSPSATNAFVTHSKLAAELPLGVTEKQRDGLQAAEDDVAYAPNATNAFVTHSKLAAELPKEPAPAEWPIGVTENSATASKLPKTTSTTRPQRHQRLCHAQQAGRRIAAGCEREPARQPPGCRRRRRLRPQRHQRLRDAQQAGRRAAQGTRPGGMAHRRHRETAATASRLPKQTSPTPPTPPTPSSRTARWNLRCRWV